MRRFDVKGVVIVEMMRCGERKGFVWSIVGRL